MCRGKIQRIRWRETKRLVLCSRRTVYKAVRITDSYPGYRDIYIETQSVRDRDTQ